MLILKFEQSGKIDDDQRRQARAIVTTLHALFGPSILPAATVELSDNFKSEYPAVLAASTAPAPDGYPTENPAAAFGETDTSAAEAFGAAIDRDSAARAAAPEPAVGGNVLTDAVERDADGIPWDKRIHAETKTKTAKGIWTRRRNTPDHLFDDVMAELKRANTARTTAALAGGAVPLPAPAPTTPAAPAPSPAPAAPAASSTAPGGLPPELTTPATSFPTMMVKITKAQSLGLLTPDALTGILVAAGAQPDAAGKVSMMAMNKDASIIPIVDALLSEHLGA